MSTVLSRPFSLKKILRPQRIIALDNDELAKELVRLISIQKDDQGLLLERHGICCEVRDSTAIHESDCVVIASSSRMPEHCCFTPSAPAAHVPPHVKGAGSTWKVMVNSSQSVAGNSGRVEGIARQIALWFTSKWDTTPEGHMPWGPLPAENSKKIEKRRSRSIRRRRGSAHAW